MEVSLKSLAGTSFYIMTDKRKKRARAIQAKSGIAYASAINQLKEQLGDEPKQELIPEEPKPPRWTFEEGKTLFDGQPVDSGTWGRGLEGEVSALSDLWPQGPDDPLLIQKLAEEARVLGYPNVFGAQFQDLANRENNPHLLSGGSRPSKNIRPYRPQAIPKFKCISSGHLDTLGKLIDLSNLRNFREQSLLTMVNIINQTFEVESNPQVKNLVFIGHLEGFGGISERAQSYILPTNPPWDTKCVFQLATVSNEHFAMIKSLVIRTPEWLQNKMKSITPRPKLRDWVKNPPLARLANTDNQKEKWSTAKAWDAKIPKQQVAPVYPEALVALCKSVVDEALTIIQKMPFSLRVGYVAGLCLQKDPEVNIPLLTNYLNTMADSWAPSPKPQ